MYGCGSILERQLRRGCQRRNRANDALGDKLVQIRRGDFREARLVDIGHDLHSNRFELLGRLMLQLGRLGWEGNMVRSPFVDEVMK
jgi:hypothetical protein